MLTIETERRISRFLCKLRKSEVEAERRKLELISNPQFNPFQCYKCLDKKIRQRIECYDIVTFMKEFQQFCTLHEAALLILFYDKEQKNYWTYQNFVNFLIVGYKNYTNSINFEYKEEDNNEEINQNVEILLINVFNSEIEIIRNTQKLVEEFKKRYDYNIIDLFTSITKTDNISFDNLNKFLIRNGLYLRDEEINGIINKLSIQKNERISLLDLKRVLEFGYCDSSKEDLYESMLKCPGGRIKVGYENNPPNRFLETDNLTFQNNSYPVSQNLSLSRKILNDSTSTPYLIKDELSNYKERFDNNYNSNLNYQDEEELFCDFLKLLLDTEILIEKEKNELALRADFNIEDAFRIYQLGNRDYITEADFDFGCKSLSIIFEKEIISLIFKKYDLVNEGILSFNSFFDMLVPFRREYREMIQNRNPMTFTPKFNKAEVFLETTRLYLQKLLRTIASSEVCIENYRKKFEPIMDVYLRNIFEKIDKDNKGYITPLDLGNYLTEKNRIILPSDSDLLFIRLDRDRNGKVEAKDFIREIRTIDKY